MANDLQDSPIFGGRSGFLRGHTIGSRRFGKVHSNSDWDYLFEDNEETRKFLKAVGFFHRTEYKIGERGRTTSFWRHSHYACELFLVKSERERLWATRVMWFVQWLQLWASKKHRWQVWHALEICFSTISAVRKDYNHNKSKRIAEENRLRPTPLSRHEYNKL
jgi:hypothetical protein